MVNKTLNFLAMDFGGSNGRGILGVYDGMKVKLQEMHRFPNYFVNQNGMFFWDVLRMFHEIKYSIKEAGKTIGKDNLISLGIDTWGTDYGLIDKNGQLIGNVRCMRNADGRAVKEVLEKIPAKQLFSATGLQTIPGNTIFQLYERLKNEDPALLYADKMLMLPDLLGYFLTGEKREEYTMVTTSMCYNPRKKTWDYDVLRCLGIPENIFAPIVYPGESLIPLLPDIFNETGMKSLHYTMVGTHDTASAVAATPLEEGEMFCSSGTWSLMGIETEQAIISEQVRTENFSNEGTVDGKNRMLKNIMGMWLIQECMRQWQDMGYNLAWDEVVEQASQVKPFESFLDTELPELYNAGDMIKKIQEYCCSTRQKVPETIGETARCIYQSVAMRYRITMEQLQHITGRKMKALRIVGGGCQNKLLDQFAANVLQIPVHCGPVEAACGGNILTQGIVQGELKNLSELREVVKSSFMTETYFPQDMPAWVEAYGAYCRLIEKK